MTHPTEHPAMDGLARFLRDEADAFPIYPHRAERLRAWADAVDRSQPGGMMAGQQALPHGILGLCLAAQAVLDSVNDNLANAKVPVCYTVPWGPMTDLQLALNLINGRYGSTAIIPANAGAMGSDLTMPAAAPEGQGVEDWREKAAEWLGQRAQDQEDRIERHPIHAEAYPSWKARARTLRFLQQELLASLPAQQPHSATDRVPVAKVGDCTKGDTFTMLRPMPAGTLLYALPIQARPEGGGHG